MPFGVYGRGLNEVAAGVKKLRSVVDVRRRLSGLETTLAEEEPEKEREDEIEGRVSDITVKEKGLGSTSTERGVLVGGGGGGARGLWVRRNKGQAEASKE